MKFDPSSILEAYGPDGDPGEALVIADWCLEHGEDELAASALDRAYGLRPGDLSIRQARKAVLDRFELREHGMVFRYVPAGTFLMGAEDGDPDERPVHPVRTPAFWIADVPVTWDDYRILMGWSEDGPEGSDRSQFHYWERAKIRFQYCETGTQEAIDWHAHAGHEDLFEPPPREDPDATPCYNRKPMVAVSWEEGEQLAERISVDGVRYALPSEAQWEKAARGGLIGCRFPWGDAPPSPDTCDFDHFGRFYIADPRRFPPNGYGLYGMAGGVFEWTRDSYDALAYHPNRPPLPEATHHTLRGGSWADCAFAVRVSFRMSLSGGPFWANQWGDAENPNVGIRLVREKVEP